MGVGALATPTLGLDLRKEKIVRVSHVIFVKVLKGDGDHAAIKQLPGDSLVVLRKPRRRHHRALPDGAASVRQQRTEQVWRQHKCVGRTRGGFTQ